MDKSRKHKESGLPQKYVGKLSDSTAKARKAHWKKMSKYSDRDPRAYEPAPGDATAKTKPSKATKEVRKMMNKEEVEITEEASKSLAAKAKKTGIPLSTLKTVYRRGVAAWNSGHRPGTTAQQWGHARVNSYIRKGKGTYHGADKDLREQNMVHSVHVSGEDKSKKFTDHVKGWGGKLHYVSDKGAAYKFKKPHQARGFTAGIKTGFRHLDAQHDGEVHEAKDPKEYGFEGEMAMSQLKGIMNHAQQLNDMLKPETDLPEWVQSKITKAYDYIQTAADYMATEMKEEVQQVDEFMGPISAPGPESIAHRKANTAMRLKIADARRKARLAKKKTAMEEAGQIDELSKDTLKSYNRKSFDQYMNMTHGPTDWNKQSDKVRDKAAQRMRGQNMADRKLGKSVYKAKVAATEEAAVNSVGSGNVAGLQGDPPVHMKKKKKVMMTFKRYMRK
jgi:lambda repressor-like predicted transcriptional regulator